MVDEASSFRRYLLGALEESAQEDFERELMTSDERFQELLIAEDELVDDYCAGKLSESDAQRYRERFLATPERRHQHRFGAALRNYHRQRASHRRPVRRAWVALAAGVAVLLAGGLWSILQTSPVRLEETAQRVEGPRVAFFLTAGRLRSLPPETEQAITVPPGVVLVELQLDLPGDASGDYDVRLEGRTRAILAEGRLTARTLEGQRVVVAAVPSELLAPGDFRVTLRAVSAPDADDVRRTYEFRVQRE